MDTGSVTGNGQRISRECKNSPPQFVGRGVKIPAGLVVAIPACHGLPCIQSIQDAVVGANQLLAPVVPIVQT